MTIKIIPHEWLVESREDFVTRVRERIISFRSITASLGGDKVSLRFDDVARLLYIVEGGTDDQG